MGENLGKGQQVERQRRTVERRLRALVTFSLGHHPVNRETYQMCPRSQMRGIPVLIMDRVSSCEMTQQVREEATQEAGAKL